MKKHVSQMSPSEIDLLEYKRKMLLMTRKPFFFSKHFYESARKRDIRIRDAKETIMQGKIVEFHDKTINGKVVDKRVLIRSTKCYKKHWNLCVVYSLWYRKVITAYYNHWRDNHATLDINQYDPNHCVTLYRQRRK